ncbi:FAD-binding molybdopterin dehydrogenase [Pedobacter psychrophilus]|uniref:FAD-binding molybdopterin dehydrogenase n=1 Tax=Pedobacter psychrophilus TaxID=1826909 RepID=A0A179DB85_9SPHI|nr:xanthine dehydrogenase family protein subunit M [Pedobacter psychrophilus]OAQ38315.1 FAD-binding molybdopterin dehydrogenase [Pedobacter psychrophilus]
MINFDYIRMQSVKSTVKALAKFTDAKMIAGGSNLIDLMKRNVTAPTKLIDINLLPLKYIEQSKEGLRIGALALNSQAADHEIVKNKFPLLAMAINAGASPQLRNMASFGGNMMQRTRCTYFYDTSMPCNKREPNSGCGALNGINRMHAIFGANDNCIAVNPSDMNVALIALDAQVVLLNAKKERKMAFADFHKLAEDTPNLDNHLQSNEMIVEILIPENNFSKNSYYVKVRDRNSYAFALVSVAAGLELEGKTIKNARLAMGGVAHKPWRLYDAENYLQGKEINTETFKEAAKIAMKGAKGYGHNDFKLDLAPASILEALMKAAHLS